MITVDTKQLKRLENDLKLFKPRAFPFAVRATLNSAAFETQKIARENVRNQMINRNRFSTASIQVDRARGLNIETMESATGSTAGYMATQEFGGTKSDPTIATGYSAGQQGKRPRTRLPRRPNQVKNIKLTGRRKRTGQTQGQRNFVAVREAAAKGRKFVYMRGSGYEGLFRVLGGRKRPRVRMVHDLSRDSVDIPRNPWLAPATRSVQQQMPELYTTALRFQLRRHRILGY